MFMNKNCRKNNNRKSKMIYRFKYAYSVYSTTRTYYTVTNFHLLWVFSFILGSKIEAAHFPPLSILQANNFDNDAYKYIMGQQFIFLCLRLNMDTNHFYYTCEFKYLMTLRERRYPKEPSMYICATTIALQTLFKYSHDLYGLLLLEARGRCGLPLIIQNYNCLSNVFHSDENDHHACLMKVQN